MLSRHDLAAGAKRPVTARRNAEQTSQLTRFLLPALAMLIFLDCAFAERLLIEGRVTGESAAIESGLTVAVDGERLEVDSRGNFSFDFARSSSRPLLIRASADGYYTALQTVHRSDVVDGIGSRIPTIELVRKKPGRRLLMFAGDTMLTRRYAEPRDGEPVLVDRDDPLGDAKALLQHIKPYVELAEFASVNLETPLSATPLEEPLPKSVTFYSPPALAEALQWAGVDYVALGNNHIFDFQRAGMESTFTELDRLGLHYSGGGHDDESARKPALVSIGDTPHAFLSYVGWRGTFSPNQVAETGKGGAAFGDEEVIASDVARVPDGVVSVVQLHAGLEYAATPSLSEKTVFHRAVEAGADIVIGHHPHVLQGFEIVDDRLIAYSLGNFLFDQYIYSTQLSALLFVFMDGESLHRAEVVPMHVNGYVPTPATGEFRYAILNRLATLTDSETVCTKASGLHLVMESCRDGQVSATAQTMRFDEASGLLSLRAKGASPLSSVTVDGTNGHYRLGVDILSRGEFEHVGLFGTDDRTWIENAQVKVIDSGAPHMAITIEPGEEAASGGLKVFDRVFTPSNPTTVAGRIRVDGKSRLRFYLQRRRIEESFSEGLAVGPLTEIGSAVFSQDGWHNFSFDYAQPRLATKGVRVLFTLEDLTGDGIEASIDDLVWIEWRTPWLRPDDGANPVHATHIQFR